MELCLPEEFDDSLLEGRFPMPMVHVGGTS